MANEIHVLGPTAQTCYAAVLSEAGLWSNAGVLEAFAVGNYSLYAITVTEIGSTGVYQGNFPSALAAGAYDIVLFLQAGGSPANGDRAVGVQSIQWQGVSSDPALIPLGGLTGPQMRNYLVHGALVRDDIDTQVYEALTDTILEVEQKFNFDEREVETVSTDTIAALGDYKINMEVDHGSLIGVRLRDGTTFGKRLTHISKAAFDLLFPTPASQIGRGRPDFFCRYAGQIQVGPTPDQTSYVYEFAYSRRLTAPITAATSDVPFSSQYREVLKYGVYARVFGDLKNAELATYYRALYVDRLKAAIENEMGDQKGAHVVLYNDC